MYAYDSHGSGDSFINRLDMYLIAPKVLIGWVVDLHLDSTL